MRILHLIAPAAFGGLETVIRALAASQSRAGHDVHVAAVLDPDTTPHPVLTALEADGVATYALEVPVRAYRQERRLVRRVCQGVQPDIVHTHGYRTDVLSGPVARALGIPTVSTAHGFIGGDWKGRLYETLQRRSYRRCAGVVAVSRPMRDDLIRRGLPASRVHWIPNAWAGTTPFEGRADARRILGIDQDARCIGFIGRISHEKGPDVLVDAVAELGGDAGAFFIGDGPMRVGLETRGRDEGLPLTWAGAVESAGRLIRAFDVVALSSRTEGTPIVLLEAMAAGVPVVATTVGGIPDVVSEQEAWLVPPEDPAAIVAALREVLAQPEEARARAGRAGARLARDLGADQWVSRYDEVYRACVGRRDSVRTIEQAVTA